MAEEAAVAVCVRVRPLNVREEELGEDAHVYWKTDKNTIYQSDGGKSFNFDRVFHSNETTKNVYEEIAVPIINSAIQGYNGTIFAYGQTASGKTHTMMGSEDCLGVIPRAIHDIFQRIKKFPEREFLLRVSYMEIYNETITDLLCNAQKTKPLIIREDINRNVYVADLTEEVVNTAEVALKWITMGEKNRHYGITKMNQRSSRSHTIFRMILESREKGESSNCDGSIKVSHLNLVDLAGSERAAQTGAEGVRLKEGCNINRSLFILGQVIKKLSDEQFGGFINYRDSKLTRILQNSLGGNAKTRIICTITPVSFDETLTTLQFASAAKYMKNTPYVNEVSNDEALLKRYRREIVDLKKQLEEVNTKTRAQEMEKDQLAQLLDEKDLLQKVQDEKIQNLKRMLVTSSSIAFQQELKVKKKRRVTWCYGKINKMKDSNYVNEFKVPTNVTTRANKTSVTLLGENSLMRLGENDESLPIESDVFNNTLEPLTEVEWSSATKLLGEENVESELSSLHAQYDDLVLDYEQLRRENEELKLKLKEKNDLEEFEALERKAEKDQEMQLIHEISNLKNLVKHAEVYNQELENEISSKVELLKEKEDQIKDLQKYIDAQKSEKMKIDLSYSSEPTEELKQVMQTLSDMDTVALDAKREAAFLRSENLRLQEKINELSDSCKQMENDTQAYQRQLEAKKKMQVDLDKELQFAFQEISKLTALVEGKGLQSNLELEKKITDLQRELNKEAEDKEILQKEVSLLSELKSLPSEVEMLRRELHEKSEELCFITSEREHLFSEVAHKDSRIQGLLEEIGNAKDDLAASQLNYKSRDEACQTLKTLHMELEQKYQVVLEESERMKQEIGNLSKEAEKLGLSLDSLNAELSHKTQELQQKTSEGQERSDQMEELREQLENRESSLQSAEKERAVLTERLQQALEEVRVLTQEKEDLKQLQASLQTERDQLKSDIQDTVNMNVDTQEQLLNALESLKQHQETINQLKMKAAEETSKNLHTKDRGGTGDEIQQKMNDVDEEQNLLAGNAQTLIAGVNDNEVTEEKRKIHSLMQENNGLQQTLESIIAEKEQLKMDLQENIEMTIENQEELRALRDELKRQQEVATQEKDIATKKSEELSRVCERLAEVEEELKEKNQKLQEKQQQLVSAEEDMSEMQQRMTATEKSQRLALEYVEAERLELTQKLHENCEKMKSLTKERNELSELQESFELERRQLKEYVREMEAIRLQTEEELNTTRTHLKEHQEIIEELRSSLTGKEAQIASTKDTEKSRTQWQEETPGLQEQELLSNVEDAGEIPGKASELEPLREHSTTMGSEPSEDIEKARELEPLGEHSTTMGSEPSEDTERLGLTEKLEESQKEVKCLTKERDDLKVMLLALHVECAQLKEDVKAALTKHLETEEELNIAHCCLKEQEKKTDALRVRLSQKETELSSVRVQLESATDELERKVQELNEKQEQLNIKETSESQEKMNELDQVKALLLAKDSTLQRIESDRLQLTKQLEESQEEMRVLIKERDELKRIREALDVENEQQKENIKEIGAKLQELQDKERECLVMKTTEETQGDACEMECLTKQLEAQKSTLERVEMENANLTQRLHETLEEMGSVAKERDELRSLEERLTVERDQLKESLKETATRGLEKEEELRVARVHLQEHQETIVSLRESVSAKADEMSRIQGDLAHTHTALEVQSQELQEKAHQLSQVKAELKETVDEMEQLKKQLEAQNSTLENIEIEKLKLTQQVYENLEKIRLVTKENDDLKVIDEALRVEQDQLRKSLQQMEANDLEKQEKLRIAHLDLKEHQETIDRLRGVVSKKTAEVSNMEMELENANIKLQEKIQELKANEGQLLKLKGAAVETQKQLKEQGLALNKIEIENLNLAQKLHENLEEMKSVIKERDNLKRVEEMLKLERDQLKENLRDTKWKDHQNHEEIVKHAKRLLYDGEQHSTESLREKCLRIKELLKRYSEMGNEYECLNSFSIDWEKETKTQKELALAIKAKLSLPHPQTKEIEKLLTTNHRCSMEFHRILKKLKYVLSHITRLKEEQHEFINKFEMAFVQEVEKQNELRIKIQSFQQVYDIPSKDLENLKLSQDMDLHIEEIAKDFAENGFPTIKTEFQQVLSNRKEITQFLGRWMNTPFDTEKLKSGIQRENNSICQVNNFYNSKIIAMINESTEFEEGNAAKCKELEHYLKSLKEKTKQLSKDYETLTVSRSAAHVHTTTQPSTQGSKNPHIASVGEQLTSEKIQELETSLQEAKKSAMHKEGQIAKMQKELAMSKDLVAKLQSEVHESNKCLENTKATVQKLQDKVALGAVPYKEEIEDLKMQLVKIDLEKKENAKEFEKEILSTKATVTHQKEVIRMLRENLRRNQQAQDTSMVSEPDSQTLRKPLTCGGGSGIVQSTKALILKSEYIRMENEISKLKQQNEQLVKQNNRLLSDKSQLSKKLETMKERTLKRDTYRESACENSPKSPKVTGADSKRRQNTPSQCRERNFQDSPKSLFSDNRAKSLPAPYPVCYFDNSALGLCPEEPAVEAENVNPKTDLYQPSSGKDGPECKMQ
ncbi:centromere-associated protein E isoform X1 [Cricetulus griseus]|uniref:Centromere-associated protein E n=1 Tax=Cricetulus griseus TaxID=10029 RepID=A0A061IQE1_CRIGR|nr:centromere-associated protein E isoform X3 [Cricetulus griseus]XP_035293720.1 centromere-associated protein E isoform X1 [Cricetulus griseus]ERE91188.1 centromere-associated protein E [Cricetulus griseus]